MDIKKIIKQVKAIRDMKFALRTLTKSIEDDEVLCINIRREGDIEVLLKLECFLEQFKEFTEEDYDGILFSRKVKTEVDGVIFFALRNDIKEDAKKQLANCSDEGKTEGQ